MRIKKFESFSNNYTFSDLEKILLNIGGESVAESPEEDLIELIEKGDDIYNDFEVKLIKMKDSRCHQNVTSFYNNFIKDNSEDEISIITGWALSDGIWRQHSWIFLPFDEILIETTKHRDSYYGIELRGENLSEFLFNN